MRILSGILSMATALSAFGSGSEVVVLYNKRVPDSKKVAEHYAKARQVPSKQVLGLNLPTGEAISRDEFRRQLQEPLLEEFTDRKWFRIDKRDSVTPVGGASVRYLVLCYGVPLKISHDPTLNEPDAVKLQEPLRRNDAAVDNELALLPLSREKRLLAGPVGNPMFTQTNLALLHPTNNLLMVARLDGPSVDVAIGLVDKAVQAETNGFWGRAYFDVRGLTNGNYKIGDEMIRGGAAIAKRLGFETALDEAPETFGRGFPMSQIALYAGWYDGEVSGPFTLPNVEFMPGAFAYHLHSYNATTIRSATSHWTGPLLAKGATITFGSVEEPFLSGTPHVAVFLERLIWNRFTFGEAAYAAQPVLSWQTTVIGDPLYRPFAEAPDQLHARLEKTANPSIEWSHLRVLNLNQATGQTSTDGLIEYLNQVPATKTSAVLQEKLGDLYRLSKRLSAAAEAYTKAAKLDPSPQQKIRLLLAVGELETLLGREKEAFDALKELVTTAPDYPNTPEVYGRMITLAKSLGKSDEVERLEEEAKKRTGANR